MFGANYYGQPYFGEGPASGNIIHLILTHAKTIALAGFNRITRRII